MFDYSDYAGIDTCIAYPGRNEYVLTAGKKIMEFTYDSDTKSISTNIYTSEGIAEKKKEKTFAPVDGDLDNNEELSTEINSGVRLGLYEDVQTFIDDNRVFLEKDERTVADWVEGKIDIDPDTGSVTTYIKTPEIANIDEEKLPFGNDSLESAISSAEEKRCISVSPFEKIKEKLYALNWDVWFERTKDNGGCEYTKSADGSSSAYLTNSTGYGQYVFWVSYDDAEGFVKSVRDWADEFDVEEHVEKWAPDAGENGVPSIKGLYEEGDIIVEMLKELVDSLEALDLDPEYTCSKEDSYKTEHDGEAR